MLNVFVAKVYVIINVAKINAGIQNDISWCNGLENGASWKVDMNYLILKLLHNVVWSNVAMYVYLCALVAL